MSEATEKQREPASSNEELATSLYRDGRGHPRHRAEAARAHRRARLRRLLASGHRPGGPPGGRRRRAARATTSSSTPTAASATRWPRACRSASCSATSSAAPRGSTGGKGGGTVHFVDPEVGVLGQGGTLGSNFVLGAGAGDLGPAARQRPRRRRLLRRRRGRARHLPRGGAPGCGLEAAAGLGLREQRLGDLGPDRRPEPDREHRRPRRRLRRARRGRRRAGRARRPSTRRPRPSSAPAPARGRR